MIRRVLLLLTIIISAGLANAGTVAIQTWSDQNLTTHRWKKRLLFLKADSFENPDLKLLKAEIAKNQAAITERHLLVFEQIVPDAKEKFVAILVGKDGEEKWRKTKSFDLNEVFQKIDSMPMRQQEM